ncbi:carbamoyltransferase HypF [Paraburkholderia xenovorans]|uniref:Carbamoyltransferase HypF n=1 Tax=Paraburkholderia xenovorans (strain LB400) TaxID=266265 RepID=Q13HK4_PARXL|nr:carbamoyltransferase HypF [Paraburkholderia xenovorans]ABE36435.1 Hydrogenase maturation protein HypF [Paraburkholderia xenovorans LB400]
MPTRVHTVRDDEPLVSKWGGEAIRVRGLVQGVGFRPAVWRLAHDCGVSGTVCNDGEGVLIRAWADRPVLERFVAGLHGRCPPLGRIDSVERRAVPDVAPAPGEFTIVESGGGPAHTGVVPDAVTCRACLDETLDPSGRRYRYPFTNCTHCGPRLSIVGAIPYDRCATTMAAFPLCGACRREYDDPGDRRFHAQAVACPACGPRIWIEQADGSRERGDPLEVACRYLRLGGIVAIKGLGGFQLACMATAQAAVTKLRVLKHRARKPFALLARDVTMAERYCSVSNADAALLRSAAGPIVIMPAIGRTTAADLSGVAPGTATLGFMLPSTPLHHLIMRALDAPIVLTSGNVADEPQCTANDDARIRLAGMADVFLMHDREIASRIDDSVARVLHGVPRLLRSSRGYAPAPLRMPHDFAAAPPVLAMGAQQKNAFCLLREGEALVSHHIGELENGETYRDYKASLARYEKLFGHDARVVAVDLHPEYLSRKLGIDIARQRSLPLAEIQHHHAHFAACLAENDIGLASNILGVVLDGHGMGTDRRLWGGEFLLGGYVDCTRVASLTPVALPGGMRAVLEPWRNTYAHLRASLGWEWVARRYAKLDLVRFLAGRPLALLEQMIEGGVNSPVSSSAGRLFDAVAAAAGVCRERVQYEGQAAIEFEALIDRRTLHDEDDALAYPFRIGEASDAAYPLLIDAKPMWLALLDDLMRATPAPVIAARFHKGFTIAIVQMVKRALGSRLHGSAPAVRTVALSGGVMQNAALFEQLSERLAACGLVVLAHRQVPANDGGIALGQAAIAAGRALAHVEQRNTLCA